MLVWLKYLGRLSKTIIIYENIWIDYNKYKTINRIQDNKINS